MNRIGEMELRGKVRGLREETGLNLTLDGFPVPPHQVLCDGLAVTKAGTPTEVTEALDRWVDGYRYANRKFAAQCVAQGLTNEPPAVVFDVTNGVFYSDTKGLVVVTVDRDRQMHEDDEAEVLSQPVHSIAMILSDGVRLAVRETLETEGISNPE